MATKKAQLDAKKYEAIVVSEVAPKKKANAPKVVYLKEGVTGKQLLKAKIEANNKNKEELHSISFCIKQIKRHGKQFTKLIKGFNEKDLTPANLLPMRTEKEQERTKFTFWMVEQLIVRFYKAKK